MFVVVDFASVGSEEKTSLLDSPPELVLPSAGSFSGSHDGFPNAQKQQFPNRPGGFIVHMVQGDTMVVCNEGSSYSLPKKIKKLSTWVNNIFPTSFGVQM